MPLAFALASGIAAQDGAFDADAAAAARSLTPSSWLAKIARTEDGRGTAERWASGPSYKVRFDDGVTFVPVLGATAPHNLPLRWRTKSLRFDGQKPVELARADATTHAADWRYELRHDSVTEAYDVRVDGVEQTFVFAYPGKVAGDLVVTGAVDTELHAAERAPRHGALSFRDANGTPVVSYGAAFAIDANGKTLPLTTSFDDGEITLRVPADWLGGAVWPITVDPLLARETSGGGAITAGASEDPAMLFDTRNSRYLLGYQRVVSASDRDTYIRALDQDLNDLGLVYSNTYNYDSKKLSLAYVQTPDHYVFAINGADAADEWVTLYEIDAPDPFSSPVWASSLAAPAGSFNSDPSIAGASAGSYAFIAWRRDPALGNTTDSIVVGATFDPVSHTIGAVDEYRSSNSLVDYDAEAPCVSQHSGGGGWMLVWQEYNSANANDDWDVIGTRLQSNGVVAPPAVFGPGGTATIHKYAPCVAGSGSRHAITFLERPNTNTPSLGSWLGRDVEVIVFDWPSFNAGPTILGSTTVASVASNSFALSRGTALAFDGATDSHWTVAWRRDVQDILFASRIGYDGGVVEAVTVEPMPASGSYGVPIVCHNSTDYEFVIAYGQDIPLSQNPVAMRQLAMDSTSASKYGDGCQGALQFENNGTRNLPYAGSRDFKVSLVGGRPQLPTWLLVCPGAGNVPLPLQPGCPLFFDLTLPVIVAAQGISTFAGGLLIPLSIPSNTADGGPLTLYWQFAQIDVTQVITSDAWTTTIPML